MIRKGLLFLVLVFVLVGCREDEIPLFEMKLEAVLDMDSGLNSVETFYFPIQNVPTAFSAYSNNLNVDNIGSIRPGTCKIEGGFASINYNFIQEIYINAIDPDVPNIKREIFYLENNPTDGANELQLFGSLLNVKDIFVNERVNLEVRVRFRIPSPGISENRISFSLFAYTEE